MKRKLSTILLSSIAALAMVIGFQNCGDAGSHSDISSMLKASFFDYPYTSAPKFYADILMLKPAGAIQNLNQFKFVGTVALPSNSAASIAYDVRVFSPQGAALCPTQTGTLTAGLSSVIFDCVTVNPSESARVVFKVTSGTNTQTFEKTF